MERITTVRLAEVLAQSGIVPTEKITDALFQQDSTGTPFVEVLIESGEVSEWEIAKIVVQHFQLPFFLVTNFEINPEAVAILDEDLLFERNIVPLDVGGGVLTVSVPILTPHKILHKIEEDSGLVVFPLVGLSSENRDTLHHLFPERPREERSRVTRSAVESGPDKSWENIFDLGDQEVLKNLDG